MEKRSVIPIFAVAMISIMLTPVHAWSYGNPAKTDDLYYEKLGPRADRLLIKLYSSETGELGGLDTGEIDVTDCPLDESDSIRYTTPPWDSQIKVMGYGAEFGLFLFDLNNNNLYLGNPEDPAYPNPVYPNPMSDLDLRKAVAYLTNRPKIVSNIGNLVAVALYTPVGPSSGKYSHPDIKPGGAREDLCYLYNPAAAAAVLQAGGFPIGPDGWRYWDMDNDHVKDANEGFTLKIVARSDSPARLFAGTDLYNELIAIKVPATLVSLTSGAARTQVMTNKNFHIYTGGWSLSVDPDFLILWNWDYYWHPGRPYNYAGCNNAGFNFASNSVMYANDQAEAVYWALEAQLAYAENVLSVPLWASTGYKAVKRAYTGTPGFPDTEDVYEGKYWEGFVNTPGYGIDNRWSFINMHPEGFEFGNGTDMTVRYGFSTQNIGMLNPIYADWSWDNTVIDLIGYDSLLMRDPYNLGGWISWMALQWSVSTYTHPVYGTCTKVVFTLRPGVEWSDGTPITIADIYFTFVEVDDILTARGLLPPWWISNVLNILSFSVLDSQNFEVLLRVKSVFAAGWISQNRILPKHIWKPIVTLGDPTTFAPDPNLINSGPWRLKEYVGNSHVILIANTPRTTVQNNLAGATSVTSDLGFFRYSPIIVQNQKTPDYRFKFTPSIRNVNVTIVNEMQMAIPNVTGAVRLTYPNGTTTDTVFGPLTVPAVGNYTITIPTVFTYGRWKYHVDIDWPCQYGGKRSPIPCPITGRTYKWHWCRDMAWVTLKEDIAGSTWYDDVGLGSYPYKTELPTPDVKVDIQDLARASGAFGSYPGIGRWNTVVDQNGDYKVDIQDIARISAKFGWHA